MAKASKENFQQKIIWDRCYDFSNILAEKFSENIGVFTQTTAIFAKI
jgi:hypothetical protein